MKLTGISSTYYVQSEAILQDLWKLFHYSVYKDLEDTFTQNLAELYSYAILLKTTY